MILRLLVLLSMFLYATFFLGSIPLLPTPHRPFLTDGTGASRFPDFNDLSHQLAASGKEASLGVALVALFFLFLAWVFVSRSRYAKPAPVAILFRFFFFLTLAFVAADYSRELSVTTPIEYLEARQHWIASGGNLGYPRAPAAALLTAIRSGGASAIDRALETVVAPPFGKIPAFPEFPAVCQGIYRDLIGRMVKVDPPAVGYAEYGVACEILKAVIPGLGSADFKKASECLYGPGVKILHALDVQHLSCPLSRIPNAILSAAVVCPKLAEVTGTREFAFCTTP